MKTASPKNIFEKAVTVCHYLIKSKIDEGAVVVDATCGNGKDTVFLSLCAGPSGKVYAFDVQAQAIEKTKQLLTREAAGDNVTLICDGHECMGRYVKEPVDLVLFNLGYLPGSDKHCVTQAGTTLQAVEKALSLLSEGGLVLIVIYAGHREGALERDALLRYAATIPQDFFNVFSVNLINQANSPPELLGIEKREVAQLASAQRSGR